LGYTDLRSRVEPKLIDMVGEALDICLRSAARPEPERFRWIHEVSWPLLRYLEHPTRKKKALLDSIRAGTTELTAFYLNFTDLFDRDTFEESIGYAVKLAREESLPLDTAMCSDVLGVSWSVPDILHARGIRYLSMAPNMVMSAPIEVERPFYWEGPKGGRVLTWSTDWRYSWYAEGLWPEGVWPWPRTCDWDRACRQLQEYIGRLESEGYRWKGLAIHAASDNAGPWPELMDFAAHWNRTHPAIEVRMATNHDFFTFMEQRHASQFAVHRGAWPDWWANGIGSAACEVSYSRKAKASLRRSSALACRLKCEADGAYRAARRAAMENVLMFDEHTWGACLSVAAPWTPTSRIEWNTHRDFACRGLIEAAGLEQALLTRLDPKAEVGLFNPHSESITAPVALRSTGDGAGAPVLIEKRSGRRIEGQRAASGVTAGVPADWYLISIPARSHRAFSRGESCAPPAGAGCLENDHYRIACDPRGRVRAVLDKRLGRPLVSGSREWSFGELVHERVPGPLGRRAFYDGRVNQSDPQAKRTPARLVRTGGDSHSRRVGIVTGPVFTSLVTSGELPGVRFEREIRLYQGLPRVDVFFRLHKQVQVNYESLYVAFPFTMSAPSTAHDKKPCEIWVENAGGVFRAGKDQLPGSATDWLSAGEYVAVAGEDRTVVLVPHDAPLIQVGAINSGKWQARLVVANGHIYSWIMNNMWPVSFPAHQEGTVELAWSLTSHAGRFSEEKARRFAAASRVGVSVRDAAGEPGVPKDCWSEES
jgi:hypothetical protein